MRAAGQSHRLTPGGSRSSSCFSLLQQSFRPSLVTRLTHFNKAPAPIDETQSPGINTSLVGVVTEGDLRGLRLDRGVPLFTSSQQRLDQSAVASDRLGNFADADNGP